MRRLFFRGALIVLVAMLASFSARIWLTHHQIFQQWESTPPEVAEMLGVLFRKASADMDATQREGLVTELQSHTRAPMRLVSMDSPELSDALRERIRAYAAVMHKQPRDEKRYGLRHEMHVFMPTQDESHVLDIALVGPPTNFTWLHWLQQLSTVLVIVVLTALLLFFPLYRRLRNLETAALRIADGDLSARAEVRSRDAVGSLAKTFNHTVSRLQELLENQRHLIQAVAHELRTPISRIRFGIEMIEMKIQATDADTIRERRVAIEADLNELDHMVKELLLYSRYDCGQENLAPIQVSPLQVVQDQFTRLSILYPDLQTSVVSALDADAHIVLDHASFDRVLRNLTENAARYAKQKMEVHLQVQDNAFTFAVHDDGPGIPAADAERILEPFVRLDDSRSRASGGVGLGLAIVARILQRNAGTISITISPLGGAAVATRWPLPAATETTTDSA
ncbi:MAG: HAMP domain-containing protein [Myxococcales bacterium]|jgi:two-component system sensor histidine kinase RstB|nr:HAMP domain-containing protein [Myxococcales bacterium]